MLLDSLVISFNSPLISEKSHELPSVSASTPRKSNGYTWHCHLHEIVDTTCDNWHWMSKSQSIQKKGYFRSPDRPSLVDSSLKLRRGYGFAQIVTACCKKIISHGGSTHMLRHTVMCRNFGSVFARIRKHGSHFPRKNPSLWVWFWCVFVAKLQEMGTFFGGGKSLYKGTYFWKNYLWLWVSWAAGGTSLINQFSTLSMPKLMSHD